jgi:hypothetical protein
MSDWTRECVTDAPSVVGGLSPYRGIIPRRKLRIVHDMTKGGTLTFR